MARSSQTKLAILGALSVEPMTGYAVRAAITETLGHFWAESFGQIYPALAELEADGLIRAAGSGTTGGRVLELSESGLAELRTQLTSPIPSTPPRNGLLLRLFFGRHLGVIGCQDMLKDALARAEASLATLDQLREASIEEPATEDRPYWDMTISAGQHLAQAQIAWLKESLKRLDDLG